MLARRSRDPRWLVHYGAASPDFESRANFGTSARFSGLRTPCRQIRTACLERLVPDLLDLAPPGRLTADYRPGADGLSRSPPLGPFSMWHPRRGIRILGTLGARASWVPDWDDPRRSNRTSLYRLGRHGRDVRLRGALAGLSRATLATGN